MCFENSLESISVCVFVPCSLPCPVKMFAALIWTRLINTLATEQWIATKNVALFSATAWKFFYFGTQRISEQCFVEYWCLTFSVNCLVGFDNCNHIPFDVLHFLASLSSQENMGILCCFFCDGLLFERHCMVHLILKLTLLLYTELSQVCYVSLGEWTPEDWAVLQIWFN